MSQLLPERETNESIAPVSQSPDADGDAFCIFQLKYRFKQTLKERTRLNSFFKLHRLFLAQFLTLCKSVEADTFSDRISNPMHCTRLLSSINLVEKG